MMVNDVIDEYKKVIKKIDEYMKVNKLIIDKVSEIERKIDDFVEVNGNVRIPFLIEEIDDLKRDIENFQKEIVKLIPDEKIEKVVRDG